MTNARIVPTQHGAAFKQLVDDTIVGLMKSGEFEKMHTRWFMSPIPPALDRVDKINPALATCTPQTPAWFEVNGVA